jgi:large subunit ribosomal protein L13
VKTYVVKASEIERNWYVVDAAGLTLGRLATRIATVLRGKHKPTYTPSLDVGDFVIGVKAAKVAVKGNSKPQEQTYYRHSQYPGGLSAITLERMLKIHPTRVIEFAVRGMLPKTSLGHAMIKKLKIYPGATHPHAAQKPQPLEI